jgi:antitoxin (DNA-binding transcriptional repressor) of toxin-antitoxin stability system
MMAAITVRKLSRDTASVIDTLEATGEPVLVVRKGKPVAALTAIDAERVEDIALSSAPEFVNILAKADEAADAGETKTLAEIFPQEAAEQSESWRPAAIAEGAEQAFALRRVDTDLVDLLTRELVARMPLGHVLLSELDAGMTPERSQRIHELSMSLVRTMVAENLGFTLQRFDIMSENILDASRVGDQVHVDRYESMLRRVAEAGQLSTRQHKA